MICPKCGHHFRIGGNPKILSKTHVRILDLLCLGYTSKEIAYRIKHGLAEGYIRHCISHIAYVFEIESVKDKFHLRIKLCDYWLSPLFKIGLKELGYLIDGSQGTT